MTLPSWAKALAGGVAAALAFATPIVDDGLVASEILGIAAAFIGGSGLVYLVPNGVPDGAGKHRA